MTLVAVVWAAVMAAFVVFTVVDHVRHRRDESAGLAILAPHIAPSPLLSIGER